MIDNVCLTAFRWFGMTSMDEVMNLSLKEFRLLNTARELRQADERYLASFEAFMINKAGLRGKNGKLLYTSIDDLYDYESDIERIYGNKVKPKITDSRIERMKKFYELKEKEGKDG